jgi:hypothetical protein
VEIKVPDIQVEGDFYVDVTTNNPNSEGLLLGIAWSDSTVNEHSSVLLYGTEDIWMLPMPQQGVNWMIRVKGLG